MLLHSCIAMGDGAQVFRVSGAGRTCSQGRGWVSRGWASHGAASDCRGEESEGMAVPLVALPEGRGLPLAFLPLLQGHLPARKLHSVPWPLPKGPLFPLQRGRCVHIESWLNLLDNGSSCVFCA